MQRQVIFVFMVFCASAAVMSSAQQGSPVPPNAASGRAASQSATSGQQFTPEFAREIVRRSVEHDQINWQRAANYTCIEEVTIEKIDGDGNQKSLDTDTYEWLVLYGQPWRRHVMHNGKPLDAKQAAKEQAKLDRFTRDRQNETAEQRDKRLKEVEQKRKRQREFIRDIPNAFDFKVLREDNVRGRPVWVIDAQPRADYHGTRREAQILGKLHATLWIDKAEYQWVKMDGELIDDVGFWLFLAKIHKGSKMHGEQIKINDELWLPHRYIADVTARIGFLSQRAHITDEFSQYRKFVADARVVSEK